MNITAAMVKELRDATGAGMMDCKNALVETKGDMEAAVDWLRTKGLVKAAGKAGRIAAEGVIAIASEGKRAAMVEVNSETDFVARNPDFQKLAHGIATAALLDRRQPRQDPRGEAAQREERRGRGARGDRHHRREHHGAPRGHGQRQGRRRGQLRPRRRRAGPRQDRRPGRRRVRAARPTRCTRSAGRSRCTSPPPESARAPRRRARPGCRRARAVGLRRSRRASRASRSRSSTRWSRAACASSTRRRCCCRRSSSSTRRRPWPRRWRAPRSVSAGPIGLTEFVCFRLGEGIEKKSTDFAAEVAKAAGIPMTNAAADGQDDEQD